MATNEPRSVDNILLQYADRIRALKFERDTTNYSDLIDKAVESLKPGPYVFSKGAMEVKEDDCWKDTDSCSKMEAKQPAGQIEVDGIKYHLNHYFGSEWENLIEALHDQPPLEIPKCLTIKPHPWQLKGASQMDWLCKSIFRGGICGDEMGLGKTLLSILVMEEARKERGSFSLVVCPAACRDHWKKEIANAYVADFRPKVVVLDDSKVTAHQLLEQQWDIVIASYNFVASSYHRLCEYPEKIAKFRRGHCPPPTPPTVALHSQFWNLLELPVKRLILDECHQVKNTNGRFYAAVKAIYRTATVMLSGTFLDNSWHDIGGLVTLLRGHPFPTKAAFMSTFAQSKNSKSSVSDIQKPYLTWLQRFLLAMVIARPSTTFKLPGLAVDRISFNLNPRDDSLVDELTLKFNKARMRGIEEHRKRSFGSDASSKKSPLGYAVLAQLSAAHPLLYEEGMKGKNKDVASNDLGYEIEEGLNETVTRLIEEYDSHPDDRRKWLELLRALPLSRLLDSARVQAFVRTFSYARKRWPNEKVVVFSIFLKFLDIVAAVLRHQFGVNALRLDGTMTSSQKEKAQEMFSTGMSSEPLLITTGAGSVGLNLQRGSIIIQTEIWWNKNCERQAYARCFRQGQEKELKVLVLIAENSKIDLEIEKCRDRKVVTNTELIGPLLREFDAPLMIPPLDV